MGAELGAATSVFPAGEQVRAFLDAEGRGGGFTGVTADPDASYDVTDEIVVELWMAAHGYQIVSRPAGWPDFGQDDEN
jgi:hypothetical protein